MNSDLVVIGQGYVGLPISCESTFSGLKVVGYDVNSAIISSLNSGQSHIDDISDEEIQIMIKKGYVATSDASCLSQTKNIVICVPTPLDDNKIPNLEPVKSALEMIAKYLKPGTLVSLESTTYPGTTEEVAVPLLEKSGLKAGKDFYLVFSPERIDPGNKIYGLKNTPKIIGGINKKSTQKAVEFYSNFIDQVHVVKGTKEAELTKLLENTYRHVNIALVNEMAKFCHDLEVDIWDVINAAKTKPFGFQVFYPGPGVGGHCIPIDPNYLSHTIKEKLGYPFQMVELAEKINFSMPHYTVGRAEKILQAEKKSLKGSKIILFGVTYKANIADQRNSPTEPIAEYLLEAGAEISYFDPFILDWKVKDILIPSYDANQKYDLAIVLQSHKGTEETIAHIESPIFDTTGKLSKSLEKNYYKL